MKDIRKYRGSLDFAEFVIDPKNKDTTPAQLGHAITDCVELLNEEDWSLFRLHILQEIQWRRERTEKELNSMA